VTAAPALERRVFSVSRAADFLEQRALVSQTGRPLHRFGDVVIKELLDNALDACEAAGVPPHIEVTSAEADGGLRLVTIADNGAGIPPEVVTRILDFATLTSDKALYRSPCRGAQGNALKTIIGIPHALGVTHPVTVEARGVRHVITVGLDPAGNVDVRHHREQSPRTTGTAWTVPLPADLDLDAAAWVRGYALVNPHATFTAADHGHDDDAEGPDSYKPTAADGWRKPLPGDPTSAWWYDPAAFIKLAASLAALGDDRPAGAFIAEFRGLSATGKRKQLATAVPVIRRVSDIAAQPGGAAALLAAMQQASTEPNPRILGQVPESHYAELLGRLYGTERLWYRHGGIVHEGVPWHIEVAVAETSNPGMAVWACNYAVSFGDPLGRIPLRTADVHAHGAGSFLDACDALPGHANSHCRAAVVHVTCAAPVFTDKGKTQLDVPAEVADVFAKVLWQAGKELHRDKRQADRADRAAQRRAEAARRERDWQPSLKAAVFHVMAEAVEQQRGGTSLPYSARSLFYKVRPLVQQFTSKPLVDTYFTQTLLPEYQRIRGTLDGLYYEPRGELHEPHDLDGRRTTPLGTRQVLAYTPPAWTYDKILVVEKAGLWEVLRASRIADRYDMAIITSEGYGTEACRSLLASMPPGDVTIFSLHDADHAGYNLSAILGEETVRMPGHHVDVIDLGLTVDEAIARGMEPETYTRAAALPTRILPRLTPAAREWFTGTESSWDHYGRPKQWQCRRVELNAFSSPGLIAYIEEGLARHGADRKVIPPADVIERHARDEHRSQVRDEVERIVAELVDIDAITGTLTTETADALDFTIVPDLIRERLDADRRQPWRDAVAGEITRRLEVTGISLRPRVAELLGREQRDKKGGR
jgi:hypothetical protein